MPAVASRPGPGNRPASPPSWCTPWSAASAGSPFGGLRAATPDAALHSTSPPRLCPPRAAPEGAIPSTPDRRRCGTPELAEGPASGSLSYSRRKGPSLQSPTSKSTQRLPSASLATAVRISNPPADPRAWLPGKSTSHQRTPPPQLDGPPGSSFGAHCAPEAGSAQCAPLFHPDQRRRSAVPQHPPNGAQAAPFRIYLQVPLLHLRPRTAIGPAGHAAPPTVAATVSLSASHATFLAHPPELAEGWSGSGDCGHHGGKPGLAPSDNPLA